MSPAPLRRPNPVSARLVIASRESRLAMWQAEHVRAALGERHPAMRVEILGMTTRGDQVLETTLAKIGGKGLFVKELEVALAEGRADIAVHSAKDVPMALADGFRLAAILPREDPRDAFVSNGFAQLEDLPPGAVVGTSSVRREAQLRGRFPALEIRPLRGNLDTRLAKLDRGDYQAIVLAVAGLTRLGLGGRIRAILDPAVSLPAAGQGALAIECRADRHDLIDLLAPLDDPRTAACVRAERAVSRALGGSCQVPLAAHAVAEGERVWLRGLVATPDGKRIVRAEARGAAADPERVGEHVAAELRSRGAEAILASLAG
ncbi:MAG: hydroxymethylbilane synthase [Burkholderiales bacterium]|nr:hydroxymethylbilane synthase [Burkholderiales bacterium]